MFTILIQKEKEAHFVGSVKEMPIMGKLRGNRCDVLIDRLHGEIRFLIKDRPDLQEINIYVEMPVACLADSLLQNLSFQPSHFMVLA